MAAAGVAAHTARTERALSALRLSGRRLVLRAKGWAVAGCDLRRRPVVTLSDAEAQAIIGGGCVRAADGGGYVLSGDALSGDAGTRGGSLGGSLGGTLGEMLAREASRHAGRRRGGRAGFAGLAASALVGEGPLSLRAVRAGVRLEQDAEQAARREIVGMSWDGAPISRDRSRRGGGEPGLSRAARSSRARLQRVSARVSAMGGAEAFALAWAMCVEGATLAGAEARFALAARSGAARLGEALEAVADAYDAGG